MSQDQEEYKHFSKFVQKIGVGTFEIFNISDVIRSKFKDKSVKIKSYWLTI